VRGLHNLARYDIRIEIRIVLHKLTIPRLVKLAKYIYRNLTFAEQVVFMGLEHTGYTPHNIEQLWIDPYDYREELQEAVEFLAQHGISVAIYNLQLCVLPKELWKFAKKSISEWKSEYLEPCKSCIVNKECGGLFSTSVSKHSSHIQAL
jgi:hypothetical protein